MDVFITLIICTIVASTLYYAKFRYSRKKMYEHASKIPGPPTLPLIGNAHMFLGIANIGLVKSFMNICSSVKDNDLMKIWLGPKLLIMPFNPEWIQIILKDELNKEHHFYSKFDSIFGQNLISSPAPIWKLRRKMINPIFNQKHLNGYIETYSKQAETLIAKLSTNIDKKEFLILPYAKYCFADTVSETTLDFNSNCQNAENREIVKIFEQVMDLVLDRSFNIWLQFDWSFYMTKYASIQKHIHKFLTFHCDKLLEIKKKSKMGGILSTENLDNFNAEKSLIDIITPLYESGKISTEDRNGELMNMLMGATDTLSATISFALMILGSLKHFQEKTVQELKEIFGDSDRPIIKDDIPKMAFLECIIKETLRLFPPVTIIGRTITKDVKLGKYTVPSGCSALIFTYKIHRLKNVWGLNADEFVPERFYPENLSEQQSSAFLPFSAGPRDCIGKKFAMVALKVILSQVLRAYEIESKFDYKNVSFARQIVLTPTPGPLISIKPRQWN